jgi:uncharacterized phage protein (TIGR02220 family)
MTVSKHWGQGYTVLPNSFWIDKNLSFNEKGVLGIILSFWYVEDKKFSVKYLVGLSGLTRRTIQKCLSGLVEKNYIKKTGDYDKANRIPCSYVATFHFQVDGVHEDEGYGKLPPPMVKNAPGGGANIAPGGGAKNAPKELTSKRSNNKRNTSADSRPASKGEIIPLKKKKPAIDYSVVQAVIAYFNEKAGKDFPAYSKKISESILELQKTYSIEQFKQVIDFKGGEWKDNPGMRQQFNPFVLFSEKFEKYYIMSEQFKNDPMREDEERAAMWERAGKRARGEL